MPSLTPWVLLLLSILGSVLINGEVTLDKVKAEAEVKKLTAEIGVAVEFNKSLNDSIGVLTQYSKDMQKAYLIKESFNATKVANMTKAVADVEELLNDAENNCGSERLPIPVFNRLLELYRDQGINADPNGIHVPPSG
ncbi:hypothetical protein A6E13_01920 [Aliivibrio fischeri]|uniref:hypothetical protein n=1 Tax=Aliivibrio fischeri TaxID=668 RepID=UPI00080DB14C|nr:hypothetical protein [Aliivibrio fischeri]OCH31311.1 hypothetical protein A6E13_01920 [Aliivibrio fischeri]